MKRSVLVLLFLAASLAAGLGLGEKACVMPLCGTSISSTNSFISPEQSDHYYSAETFLYDVTVQMRNVVRNQYQQSRLQRINHNTSNNFWLQHLSATGCCSNQSIILTTILNGQLAHLSHNADYLQFGRLII